MRFFQLLSWGVLIYIGYRILMGFLHGKKNAGTTPEEDRKPEGSAAYLDPVCGRYVSEDDAVTGRNGDEKIHFCSMECLEKYREKLQQESRSIENHGR